MRSSSSVWSAWWVWHGDGQSRGSQMADPGSVAGVFWVDVICSKRNVAWLGGWWMAGFPPIGF